MQRERERQERGCIVVVPSPPLLLVQRNVRGRRENARQWDQEIRRRRKRKTGTYKTTAASIFGAADFRVLVCLRVSRRVEHRKPRDTRTPGLHSLTGSVHNGPRIRTHTRTHEARDGGVRGSEESGRRRRRGKRRAGGEEKRAMRLRGEGGRESEGHMGVLNGAARKRKRREKDRLSFDSSPDFQDLLLGRHIMNIRSLRSLSVRVQTRGSAPFAGTVRPTDRERENLERRGKGSKEEEEEEEVVGRKGGRETDGERREATTEMTVKAMHACVCVPVLCCSRRSTTEMPTE